MLCERDYAPMSVHNVQLHSTPGILSHWDRRPCLRKLFKLVLCCQIISIFSEKTFYHILPFAQNSFSQSSDENEHLTVARATRAHCNQRNMIGVEIPFYCLADTHTRHPNILDDIPFSVAVYRASYTQAKTGRQAVSLSIGIQTWSNDRNVNSGQPFKLDDAMRCVHCRRSNRHNNISVFNESDTKQWKTV